MKRAATKGIGKKRFMMCPEAKLFLLDYLAQDDLDPQCIGLESERKLSTNAYSLCKNAQHELG